MPEQRRRKRPVPACRERHVDAREWVFETYTAALSQFYRPCRHAECYPDGGSPDAGKRVIRSANGPNATAVHRPAEHDPRDDETETAAADRDGDALDMTDAVPLCSLGDLDVGDDVIWPARERPLIVEATEWPLELEATIRGPSGGTYTLRERDSGEFWIYPRYAHVESLRYLPADTPLSE